MTRMTGPDCAVMCNLINTHTHTHTHTHTLPLQHRYRHRTFGEFGKTSIPVLNPAEPTSERQQADRSVEDEGVRYQSPCGDAK